jgi:hypothetical protein
MLLDPHVNIGYRVLCSPITRATWKVKCDNQEAGEWIDRCVKTFWKKDLSKALMMLVWGSVPGELTWSLDKKTQVVNYEAMHDFRVLDTRPLCLGRKVVGFRLAGNAFEGDHGTGADNILQKPRSFWLTNEPDCGSPFGKSRLVGAWAPWMEKAGAHGARDARKLWNFKCAFNGGILRHPTDGEVMVGGVYISCQEYAMRVLEMMENGHVMTLPNDRDANGNLEWEYTPATINSDASTINNYPNLVGEDIWLGMGIMPEVIKAAATGSGYSGRSIPYLTFLSSCDMVVNCILMAVCHWIIDPGLEQNFGEVPYEVEADSLVPKDTDSARQPGQQQPPGQDQQQPQDAMSGGPNPAALMGGSPGGPVQMSQVASTGRQYSYTIVSGNYVESRTYRTVRTEPAPIQVISVTTNKPALALSSDTEPKKRKKFASTQFDIADGGYTRTQGSAVPAMKAMAARIADADLAPKGRDENLHATVKYGIHDDEPGRLRQVVHGFGSVNVVFGKTAVFPNGEDGDAVYVAVDSPDLHRLNALVSDALDCTDTHPTYIPHVCIAYVKAGEGAKYAGMDDANGMAMIFTRLAFSDRDKEKTTIELVDRKAIYAAAAAAAVEAKIPTPAPAPVPMSQDDGWVEIPDEVIGLLR